jgi:hypothetical protein
MKTLLPFAACLALLVGATLRAADQKPVQAATAAAPAPTPAAPTDPDLPQPVDLNQAQNMVTNSPFTRVLSLSDSLILTGIAYIEGKPVATILNKATKESYVVSEEPNAQGWKLADTSASRTLNRTQAKLVVGSEIVTVRYSDEQTSPEAAANQKGRGGPPGSDGGDRPRGSYSRGSEEDRQRFMALSDNARSKFIEKMRESREKMGNASPEERSTYVKKVFEKVERDDKDGKYR